MQERMKERVEQEIFRRAVLGVERAVWHKGEVVGREVRYSDQLLLALVRRVDPAGWGERTELAPRAETGLEVERVRQILSNPEALALAQRLAEVLDAWALPHCAGAVVGGSGGPGGFVGASHGWSYPRSAVFGGAALVVTQCDDRAVGAASFA